MLKFVVSLTFILLTINAGLLIFSQQGLLPPSYGLSDLNTATWVPTAVSADSSAKVVASANEEKTGEILSNPFSAFQYFLYRLFFGYQEILTAIFPPEMQWIVSLVTLPLGFVQIIGTLYIFLEVIRAIRGVI
jgi:hypothetical protein